MTEIRERPILFSSEMVRAVLDDRKTETRRVIKFKPWIQSLTKYFVFKLIKNGIAYFLRIGGVEHWIKSPYGKPGDILYVREAFDYNIAFDKTLDVFYKADIELFEDYEPSDCKWKPSIHMPKKFSRIKLKIKEIRVERIQDISNDDCLAEGVLDEYYKCPHGPPYCSVYKGCFRKTWDSLNKKRGFGWETNCFVWVIKFERIK